MCCGLFQLMAKKYLLSTEHPMNHLNLFYIPFQWWMCLKQVDAFFFANSLTDIAKQTLSVQFASAAEIHSEICNQNNKDLSTTVSNNLLINGNLI